MPQSYQPNGEKNSIEKCVLVICCNKLVRLLERLNKFNKLALSAFLLKSRYIDSFLKEIMLEQQFIKPLYTLGFYK